MTTRPRLTAVAVLVLALGATGVAVAQPSPAERADQLNEDGKDRFRAGDLDGAANKFQQAIVLSPQGRFYFNLCYIYEKQGKYREAMTACEAVKPNGAEDRVIQKADALMEQIRPNLPAAPPPGDTDASDTGEPGPTDPNADLSTDPNDTSFVDDRDRPIGGPPTSAPPGPADNVIQAPPPPPEAYRWALGVGLGAVSSAVGAEDAYGSSGGQVRLHADFLVFKDRMMGVSPYINITQIAAGAGFVEDSLDIVDFGGALYKHLNYRGYEITPLGGVHIAALQPESFDDRVNMVTLGLRGEVALSKAFGAAKQHVLSVTAGINIYFPAKGGGDIQPGNYGLDVAGSTVILAINYAHRFTTPFGQMPLITLE